jgi:hypothetical protein
MIDDMIGKSILTILIVSLGWSLMGISFNDRTPTGLQRAVARQLEPASTRKHSDAYQQQSEAEQKTEQIDRFLPGDPRMVLFDPDGDGTPEKAILTAHLKDKSQQQTATLYGTSMAESGASIQPTRPLSLVIFSRREGQLYKEWETQLAGPRLWGQEGKDIGFQVVDVSADGKDEIMTITGIGASLGADLQIFAWDGKSYQQINPRIDGHYFQFDRDARGNLRIRVRSRYEESFHVYEWDGKQYREVNAKSYSWWEAELYESILLGSDPLTPYIFGDYLRRAVSSYRRNGEINKAINLCEQAVQVIDIPGKLIPVMPSDEADLTSEQLKAIRENFDLSRRSIPALPHLLLGELNEQVGNLEEALRHYERASHLDPSDKTPGNRIRAVERRLRSPLR